MIKAVKNNPICVINISFLEDSTTFLIDAARLSDDSIIKTSFLVQLMRDCGDDLFCSPWLIMTLKALDK